MGKSKSKRAIKASRYQAVSAGAVITVGLVLTALSLTHLSHGIELVTHAPAWEAWLMAIGIDLGFIALEMTQLVKAKESTIRAIRKYVQPSITGTLIGSAVMNAFAFGVLATGYMMVPAVAFGLAIPLLIFAMFKVGAKMWLDR